MFLECLRASIIGLERADLSVIGSHVHEAKNVGAVGARPRSQSPLGGYVRRDSRIETGGLSSFLDDSEGISATIARRASAAAGAFLVTEVPHAPYGPSRGLPVTPHQRLRPYASLTVPIKEEVLPKLKRPQDISWGRFPFRSNMGARQGRAKQTLTCR